MEKGRQKGEGGVGRGRKEVREEERLTVVMIRGLAKKPIVDINITTMTATITTTKTTMMNLDGQGGGGLGV